jgi:hypothetical protein
MNTINQQRNYYVTWNGSEWVEVADPTTDMINYVCTASDVVVTNPDGLSQSYMVVFFDQFYAAKRNVMQFMMDYWIVDNLGKKTHLYQRELEVNKDSYVDLTNLPEIEWLKGADAFEDDLDNEILNGEGASFDPPRYEQKLKANVMRESSFFIKQFGLPSGMQFDFQYLAILTQSTKNLL